MRRPNDQYFTPTFATDELLKRVTISGRVLECCVGDWAIAKQLLKHRCEVLTNDIDLAMIANYHLDVSLESAWSQFPAVDFVVTNPPFNQAALIVPLAFKYARVGIAMLLRKTYTEPTFNRQQWLHYHKSNFSNQIFLPRILNA